MRRILIAGIGNIFHGDDAFGVEVVRRFVETAPMEFAGSLEQLGVRALLGPASGVELTVADFGIRAYDLAFALTGNYSTIILVDAVPRGRAPGTLCLIEPDATNLEEPPGDTADPHSMDPVAGLRMARALGGSSARLFLVGCEPATLDTENGRLGLSEPVQAALPAAIAMIESLVNDFLTQTQNTTAGLVPA